VRTMLRKMTDLLSRITAPGATLNAMREVHGAASSIADLEIQLRRVCPTSSSQAA
jgi:hypothetical protein